MEIIKLPQIQCYTIMKLYLLLFQQHNYLVQLC